MSATWVIIRRNNLPSFLQLVAHSGGLGSVTVAGEYGFVYRNWNLVDGLLILSKTAGLPNWLTPPSLKVSLPAELAGV
jgi:hypothetical protein